MKCANELHTHRSIYNFTDKRHRLDNECSVQRNCTFLLYTRNKSISINYVSNVYCCVCDDVWKVKYILRRISGCTNCIQFILRLIHFSDAHTQRMRERDSVERKTHSRQNKKRQAADSQLKLYVNERIFQLRIRYNISRLIVALFRIHLLYTATIFTISLCFCASTVAKWLY